MNKPLIGITPSHDPATGSLTQRPAYFQAVAAAGGLPLLLPLRGEAADWAQLARLCSGLLFSGGVDPHPFLFGEETLPGCGEVSPERDEMERALLTAALDTKVPILGICRGIQLINVALGGDLYQDLEHQHAGARADGNSPALAHRQPFTPTLPAHHVTVTRGSLLWNACGEQPRLAVNSLHHQAVRRPAPGLVPCAYADDGVIEALEHPGYPFLLAVQWHPEYLQERDPAQAGIFAAFLKACHEKSETRP